jgi:hypothetical protein
LRWPTGPSSSRPAGRPFDVLYSTTARWRDGKIVEEYLFYDNGAFLSQFYDNGAFLSQVGLA